MEQTLETEHEFVENVPQQEMQSVAIIPTNSKESMNEQEMEQQRPLGQTDATVKPSQENNLKGSTSEKNVASTLSTISETTRNELPIQLAALKHKKEGDEERAIASPPIAITKPLSAQDVDVKICQETSSTNEDQVSLNDEVVMKVSSNIEDQFSKDDDILVSKSRPSSQWRIQDPRSGGAKFLT